MSCCTTCRISFFLVILFSLRCINVNGQDINHTNQTPVPDKDFMQLRIAPYAAQADEPGAGEIFDSVEYIPLETTNASMFGRIDQMEITDNYFIILDERYIRVNDKQLSAILIFTKAGKFHAKISDVRTSSFVYDDVKQQIIIKNNDSPNFHFYTLDGRLIKKEQNLYDFSSFNFIGNRVIYYTDYYVDKFHKKALEKLPSLQTSTLLIADYPVGFKTGFLPIDTVVLKTNDHLSVAKTFFKSADYNYFSRPNDYNIYRIKGDSVFKAVQFIFPISYTLPPDFMTNIKYEGKKINFIENNPNIIFSVTDFYRTGANIFFRLKSFKPDQPVIIYNTKNSFLTSLTNIKGDATNGYLPLGDKIYCADDRAVYTYVNALDVINRKKENDRMEKTPNYPVALKDFFKKATDRNNVVIVKLLAKN
ncbi:MAG: hypothetical protein JWQ66_1820 [Mucilaginibacter sp.]|nr:hypothetical protein [Mucilaginibacter sp.]